MALKIGEFHDDPPVGWPNDPLLSLELDLLQEVSTPRENEERDIGEWVKEREAAPEVSSSMRRSVLLVNLEEIFHKVKDIS